MSPRRVGRGRLPRRYVDEQVLPYFPGVQDQGEVSNAEFREAIRILSQAVTNQIGQQRGAPHERDDTSRIRVMRFGKKGKLSPRYIGPYRIAKRIGNVAYELEGPQELAAVHPIFHISMLKKCIGDPSLILPTESVGIKDSLSYEKIPIQFLDRQVRRLRTKDVASVKVLKRN
ncbi:hypothetical protein MTR67_001065 [Solanum verrucosum]|uniref:Tf2-1-like SH3-like domain-containing protein n=1 Tax=Solanum verrucosum TaxID=315347 RepID=A0AAF0PR50_SOLVR|nr:hypothetical protein MTR67_001065 [Solanum verrucosum]